MPQFAYLLLFTLVFSGSLLSQSPNTKFPNLDFEQSLNETSTPAHWQKWGSDDYAVLGTKTEAHDGKWAMTTFPTGETDKNSFGGFRYAFPAPARGKKFILKAYMRTEDVENGFAGLVLRVDGPAGVLEFKDMEAENIHGTNDWKEYQLVSAFPLKAKTIFIGGMHSGSGKVWFDDFRLFVNSTPIEKWIDKPVKLPLAAKDNAFEKGTDIKLDKLNDFQIDQLYKLGKVWGHVKYRHPDIAAGDINWDNELFRVLPKVLTATTPSEANDIIFDWIPVPTRKTKAAKPTPEEDVKLAANNAWVDDPSFLGRRLSKSLSKMHVGKYGKNHYYFGFHRGIGNPNFKNEKAYEDMAFDDDGLKLLCLFRYWNMIEYFFPNRHLMDEPWDAQLRAFIPLLAAADDELAYKLVLLELIGKIQDTHASVWGKEPVLDEFWGHNSVPAEVNFIEGKLVVVRLFDGAEKTDLKVGDVLLEIGKWKVDELVSKISRYSPASNRPVQLRNVSRKILRCPSETIHLKLERDGKMVETMAHCIDKKEATYWKKDNPAFEILEDQYGYLYPGNLQKGQIDDIIEQLKDTKGLVIDFRCYPADRLLFKLGKFLVPEKTEFVRFTKASIDHPGEFTYSDYFPIGGKNKDAYPHKVVIIVNEITQSSAEYHSLAFRATPNATVIGSTTSGADGNVSQIILPGAVSTMISGIGVLYPDGRETQRVGIVPDEVVLPTVEGIREGRDELLDHALGLLRNQ